uniref:Ig-like domain-containing protein n=1 Tax=Romanomermis culicivorax TaxID=13658 RepID=A0A915L361_ROMCU
MDIPVRPSADLGKARFIVLLGEQIYPEHARQASSSTVPSLLEDAWRAACSPSVLGGLAYTYNMCCSPNMLGEVEKLSTTPSMLGEQFFVLDIRLAGQIFARRASPSMLTEQRADSCPKPRYRGSCPGPGPRLGLARSGARLHKTSSFDRITNSIYNRSLEYDKKKLSHKEPLPAGHFEMRDKVSQKKATSADFHSSQIDEGFLMWFPASIGLTDNVTVEFIDKTNTNISQQDNVTLSCIANGTEKLQIRWFRNGVRIKNDQANGDKYSFVGKTLRIKQPTFAQNGVYSCEALNSAGAAKSWKSYPLFIPFNDINAFTRESFRPSNEHYFVGRNKDFEVTCTPPEGNPTPKTYWRNSKVKIGSTGRVTADDDLKLTIQSASSEDSGEYHCVAENLAGTAVGTINVHVTNQPRITFHPASSEVNEGSLVLFTCNYEGDHYPATVIEWRKTGELMPYLSYAQIHVAGASENYARVQTGRINDIER